jgi:hypothetical protein
MPIIALIGAALTIGATQVASAQLTPPASNPAQPILTNVLAFKSQPDECFIKAGSTGNIFPKAPPCPSGSQPKVNTSYAWGMTETGSNVWIGTAVSGLCLTAAGLQPVNSTGGATTTPSYVCEFNNRAAPPCPSPTCSPNNLGYGDWRPPKIYHYDTKLKKVTDYSSACSATAVGPTCASTNLNLTVGLRSAGSTSSIVFLAGLSIVRPGSPTDDPSCTACTGGAEGIYLFAFTPTGTYLGSTELTQYSDIRRWVVMNGQIYAGVRKQDKTGRLLHWIGTTKNPFLFEEVGELETEPSYINVLGDQIYATTWGGGNAPNPITEPSGLWVSPHKPVASDFAACDNGGGIGSGPHPERCWRKIWDTTLYEPDFITGLSLIGGALEVYNNQVYWGLMQVPGTGVLAYTTVNGLPGLNAAQFQTLYLNTSRATPLFRYNPATGSTCMPAQPGNPLPTPNACQMLYGTNPLPVGDSTEINWTMGCPQTGCQTALYGAAGFGNPKAFYMWASSVYQNRLYFGTLDWSFIDAQAAYSAANPSATAAQNNQAMGQQASSAGFGGDLWRIDSPTSPAKAESLNGLSNYLSYGIRNMVADSCNLYVGMANAMNLRTSGTPQGGMEFRVLSAPAVHVSGC